MNLAVSAFRPRMSFACSSCSGMGRLLLAANSPLPVQKVQPPEPTVPSRFGQVQPEESESL